MFKGENFVYFLTVTGFFVAIMFSVLNGFEPMQFLYAVFVISTFFYIIGMACTSFFVKYVSIKNIFYLDKNGLEKTIDMQIDELDTKEEMIRDAYYFIKQIEQEEFNVYRKRNK